MRKSIFCLFVIFSLSILINAQTSTTNQVQTSEKRVKAPAFRANKDQISQAQKFLRVNETGKFSKEDRNALKTYQKENGLRANGSLNRATLEKMGIELTDKQKEIPVSPTSYANNSEKSETKAPRKAPFRATKDQITQAQQILKTNETGELSKEDREALRKYQEANGIKPTGGLNKVTLEKMGIELTDKQKEY